MTYYRDPARYTREELEADPAYLEGVRQLAGRNQNDRNLSDEVRQAWNDLAWLCDSIRSGQPADEE